MKPSTEYTSGLPVRVIRDDEYPLSAELIEWCRVKALSPAIPKSTATASQNRSRSRCSGAKQRQQQMLVHNGESLDTNIDRPMCGKIVLIGDASVGKTALISRLKYNTYEDSLTRPTIGVEYTRLPYCIRGISSFQIEIFDTAGSERFHALTDFYMRGAGGALLTFDVSKKKTFKHLKYWYTSLQKSAPDVAINLIGMKCDLTPRISREQAEEYARSINVPYFECSAKDGTNVEEVFDNLACQVFSMVATLPDVRLPVPPVSLSQSQSKCD